MRKTIKIVGNVLFYSIILFILIFAVMSVVSKKNNGVAKIFGYSPVVVISDSMKGENDNSFNKGDLIFIQEVKDFSTIQKNKDVVTFYDIKDGKTIVNSHRVIEVIVNDDGSRVFRTKGDNSPDPDTFALLEKDIIGVYRTKISNIGSAILFMQSSIGFFLFVVLPAIIFLIYELIKFIKLLMLEKIEKDKIAESDEIKKLKEELEALKKGSNVEE